MKFAVFSILSFINIITSFVSANERDNIAVNRACYQSSATDYNYVAHLTTDGYLETFWRVSSNNRSWIYVDLGGVTTIDEVVVFWGSSQPEKFEIEISSEGLSFLPTIWRKIQQYNTSDKHIDRASLNGRQAQYIRVNSFFNSTDSVSEIKEFQVFSAPIKNSPHSKSYSFKKDDLNLNGDGWFIKQSGFVKNSGI